MKHIMDKKDHQILDILKEHGEYTTRQIAKKTLLPITTVHNRVRKLREEGFIKKYTIVPDYAKLERNFVAYILISVNIGALKEKKKSQYDVVNDLKRFWFVEKADIVSGGTDIVATIRVKDVDEFDQCLLTKLQLIEGVDKTQSLIVIHSRH